MVLPNKVREGFKRVSCLAAGIFLLLSCGSALGASLSAHHKMSGDLSDLVAKRAGLARETKKVIFYTQDVDAATRYIRSRGGSILRRNKKLITAKVPVDNIEDIVGNASGITYARLPRKLVPCQITSEGVHLIQADTIQSAGITGSGVKIAVLDLGFIGLATAKSNGELPSNVITYDFTGSGIESDYKHGVACAEIVYDMAPGAQIYLLKVADEADIADAATYCKTNGIKIVTASIGVFGTGPGNGTGPVDELCDDLKANGILVVAAAGNPGNTHAGSTPIGTHWRGTFIDSGRNYSYSGSDNDINQFIPGDPNSWYNVIGVVSIPNETGVTETEITVVMRWNDWPAANSDYDIFLLDYYTDAVVAHSTAVQNGSQPPLEFLDLILPNDTTNRLYKLLVTKKSGSPAGKEVEIMLGGTCFFIPFGSYSSPIATSVGSLYEPADSQSVITVGAIDYHNWTIGPQEDFSSQGPTNAWAGSSARVKPDICGPDGTSSYTYGTNEFYGTSAATPHVAGAAALILAMHPQYDVNQLRTAVETNAIDMGSSGKDNIYGNGRVVASKSMNSTPVLEWTGEPGYVSDGLEPESGNGSTPYVFRIKYKDADGDAPFMHDLYIDKNGDGDYADPGEVVTMTATGSDHKAGVIYTCTVNIPYSTNSSNCSYYFRFWDAVSFPTGNITSALNLLTAINKPDVFQSLSLTIDRTGWQLPGIPAGSSYITDNTNKVKVSNAGDGPQAYSLRITGQGNGWSASSAKDGADVNKFVLSALFSPASQAGIDSSYFNEAGNDDVVQAGSAFRASATSFGSSRLTQGGFSVLPGSDRNLWIEFKAPTKDTARVTQSISVTINAEAQ